MNQISPIAIEAPCVRTMPAETYHRSEGVSKSKLDLVHESPALVPWARDAPEDPDAEAAVDTGSALHALLLEPETFSSLYVPDFAQPAYALVTTADMKAALDTRGIAYKGADTKQVLVDKLLSNDPNAPVADALQAEWSKGIRGRIVLTRAEHRKLMLMRDSVMAHPTARLMLEADGFSERCHYWTDEETGELCRSRIDREIPVLGSLLDLKTTATIDRFDKSVAQYRYHVQDVFYSESYLATQGEAPKTFVFLLVGTVRDRKRYPVRLKQLTNADRDIARIAIRRDLAVYSACRKANDWNDVETMTLPSWAN